MSVPLTLNLHHNSSQTYLRVSLCHPQWQSKVKSAGCSHLKGSIENRCLSHCTYILVKTLYYRKNFVFGNISSQYLVMAPFQIPPTQMDTYLQTFKFVTDYKERTIKARTFWYHHILLKTRVYISRFNGLRCARTREFWLYTLALYG